MDDSIFFPELKWTVYIGCGKKKLLFDWTGDFGDSCNIEELEKVDGNDAKKGRTSNIHGRWAGLKMKKTRDNPAC